MRYAFSEYYHDFRLGLVYAPTRLSLLVRETPESTFFIKECFKCNYRHSLKCTGGLASARRTYCFSRAENNLDSEISRIEANMPWVIAGLNLDALPEPDWDYDCDDLNLLSLHTPVTGGENYTLALGIRTGNTNNFGKVCIGDFPDSEDPLNDLIMDRHPGYLDGAGVVANILSRVFNQDYTVPQGTTSSWLANLSTNNTAKTILTSGYSSACLIGFPSGPLNSFTVQDDEELVAWIQYPSRDVAIQTSKRYYVPKQGRSFSYDEFNRLPNI
jgi:hypothetical protein